MCVCLFLRQDPVLLPRLASVSGSSCLTPLGAEIISVGCHVPQPSLLCDARVTSYTFISLLGAQDLEFKHTPTLIVPSQSCTLLKAVNWIFSFQVAALGLGLHSPALDSIQSPLKTKNSEDLVKSPQEVMI